MNIISIFLHASMVVKLIILLLLVFSVISWAIIIQKYGVTHRAKLHVKSFEKRFWEAKDMGTLYKSIELQESFLTGTENIFFTGYKEYLKLSKTLEASPLSGKSNAEYIMDASIRAMNLTAIKEIDILRKNTSFLAIISSSSPYIGLFGTVYGIMSAFMGLASKQSSLQSIAPGIAEALIATGMGLFAAIPAVIAYNTYSNKIDTLEQEYYNFMDEFTAVLQRHVLNSKSDV